ncbi:hypothetical protein LB572_06615 [Mesorhizobium sp. BH1-1-5]|uniref:hypothetical protein n=1 Tax=Mesorhizobium sp. BH1-1-5 TaxID=2876661 RepID=UPI001CC8F24B|nr:hypothetical protein [Mesorhizobium sp. BH1-1-5]MBZ9986764.1 hypothetical protein [Mesorhizobium sp. BH1-1-5]
MADSFWGDAMALSNRLFDQDLTFQCPRCHVLLVKKGSWIKSITSFKCERCQETVRLPYGDKLAIFERHLRLVG